MYDTIEFPRSSHSGEVGNSVKSRPYILPLLFQVSVSPCTLRMDMSGMVRHCHEIPRSIFSNKFFRGFVLNLQAKRLSCIWVILKSLSWILIISEMESNVVSPNHFWHFLP